MVSTKCIKLPTKARERVDRFTVCQLGEDATKTTGSKFKAAPLNIDAYKVKPESEH